MFSHFCLFQKQGPDGKKFRVISLCGSMFCMANYNNNNNDNGTDSGTDTGAGTGTGSGNGNGNTHMYRDTS